MTAIVGKLALPLASQPRCITYSMYSFCGSVSVTTVTHAAVAFCRLMVQFVTVLTNPPLHIVPTSTSTIVIALQADKHTLDANRYQVTYKTSCIFQRRRATIVRRLF